MKENIDYVIKKRNNGEILIIKEISYKVARKMIIENHYSKKWNTSFGKYNYGIFKDDKLLGVAVYGNLMNPNSATNIVESGKVIELNRLWIDDELGHNTETMMISATITLLKNNTDYDAIQSFADGRLGCGTIYKASNFNYYGYDESIFYEHIETKETFHQAPLDNTKRPHQFLKLNILKLTDKILPFVVKTYRYIIPIRKKVKIKLESKPYPEYEKGYEYIDITYPIGTLSRLLNMYNYIKFDYGVELCLSKLNELYKKQDIENELQTQKENESYIWFVNEYNNTASLYRELNEIVGIEYDGEQLSLF